MTFVPVPPEYQPPLPPEWATLINDRVPQFKVHRLEGHARQAVNVRVTHGPRGGIVYHLQNGKWEVVERVPGTGLPSA